MSSPHREARGGTLALEGADLFALPADTGIERGGGLRVTRIFEAEAIPRHTRVLEIPELNAFYAERPDGVELLAISIDTGDRAEIEAWVREQGVAYPVALGDEELARLYGATSFPLHLLISPDGRVVERLSPGYHDRHELLEFVARHAGG